jgi:hypothetical protein
MKSVSRRPAALLAAATLVAVVSAPAIAPAQATPGSTTAPGTLVVSADHVLRPVTQLASGSLYGLATPDVPAASLVKALHPNTFVQMAPGGHQLPNGEPAPAGDALVVAPDAARAGAKVVVRMPDWYPNFPYQWVSWDDWLGAVDTQVASVQASSATNVSAYELWNEPDWTWNEAAAGPFDDGWVRTFREVRSKDASTPIQGPSYSTYQADRMKTFLQKAIATHTVPEIIAWHELEHASSIPADVAAYRALESSLGLSPRPIAIEEYATPSEVGVPGALVGYIAKFERAGVDNAELAFWNHYGTLGDLLTDTGGAPNGAYWLYTWYGQMRGNMVVTTPPGITGIDGAASVTPDRRQVSVIFGGGSGAGAVTVNGLDKLAGLGRQVDVKLEYTPSKGRTTAVTGPVTISETTYAVSHGSITVPVAMNATSGYHLVITAHGRPTSLAGTYRVSNLNSGLALGTVSSRPGSASPVVQATPSARRSQVWTVVPAGSGLYTIVNAKTLQLLGIQGASSSRGAPAVVWGDARTPDHLWQLVPDGLGHDKIANAHSGMVLGVTDRSTSPGATVIQWPDGAVTSLCTATGARVPGRVANALRLCGNGEYVSLPTGFASGVSGDFTVSAWVNPARASTWQRVYDFGSGTGDYMFLTTGDGAGTPRFAITTTGGGAGEQQIEGADPLPLNAWSLVTVTVSGSTGTMYVDGVAVGSNPNLTLHPSDLGATTQNWIGRSQYNDPYLNGQVDDVNLYSRALSAAEVATLASGSAGAGDVAHYAFDESTGATAIDSSAGGHDGTIISDPQSTTTDDAAVADQWWTFRKAR